MLRPLAVFGFTMLFTLFVLSPQNMIAIGVAATASLIALSIFMVMKNTRRNGTFPLAALAVLFSCILLFMANNYRQNVLSYADKEIQVEANLTDIPYSKDGNNYYLINVTKVNGEEANFNLRLSSFSTIPINPQDSIVANVKTMALGESSEDVKNYYKSEKLYLSGYTKDDFKIIKNTNKSIHSFILNAKVSLKSHIIKVLPNENGALLSAMVLGDKSDLSKRTLNGFSAAGISHLLVVSGLHITTFCAMVYMLLKKLLGERNGSLLSILFIVFFVCLTGANPPAVRAGVMLTFLYVGNLFYKEADSLNSIGAALIILLINNPFSALSVSLLLSVMSTVGIVCYFEKIKAFLIKPFEKYDGIIIKKITDFIISSVAISVSVIITTLPIYVTVFNTISLIMVFANLLAVGVASICMMSCGIAVVFFSVGLQFVGNPIIMLSSLIASFLRWVADIAFNIKVPLMSISSNYSKIVLAVIALFIAYVLIFSIKNKRFIRISSLVLVCSFLIVNIGAFSYNTNNLELSVADVGDGVSTVIKHKNQIFLIVDSAEYYAVSSICDIMSRYGKVAIDYLIVPDSKSSKNANTIIENYEVRNVFVSDESQKRGINFNNIEIINKNVFSVDDSFKIALDKNYLQVYFGDFYSLICFNDNYTFSNAKGNVFISEANIPAGINTNDFNINIISCNENPKDGVQKNNDTIYTTKDNGSISFIIKPNGQMNYWRTN